jgi:hypothetical protein
MIFSTLVDDQKVRPRTSQVVITIRWIPAASDPGAFRPTFDELKEASLLIHLIDIMSPFRTGQSVEKILLS